MKANVIISCEHGGNIIPSFLKSEVKIPLSILESHRGFDKGALEIAKILGEMFGQNPLFNINTRLVIDYNRSLHNKNIWSKFSKDIDKVLKDRLVEDYSMYRSEIHNQISKNTIHLSVHSFTPKMNGAKRNCDFAVLYDPSKGKEKKVAKKIKSRLNLIGIKCRLNYPYQGKSDGITTYFRKKHKSGYSGLELEFNQSIVGNKKKVLKILKIVYSVLVNEI